MGTLMTGAAQLSSAQLHSSSSVQEMTLGAKVEGENGNIYRYVLAGGTTLVVGKLQQSPAVVANHQNMTCAVNAIGATEVTFTLGATAATKDQYKDGTFIINDVTGEGQTFIVEKNPAADSGASITITLKDPLSVATAATSQASLFPNIYNGVIVNPTTPTGAPVGVAVYPIPTTEYGFIQTRGPVSCLNDGGTTVGLAVAPSQGQAGAVKTGATTLDSVGANLQEATDTEYNLIDIRLD